jgi:diketogulonate reductase-like aldo/keto reductase
MNKLPNKIRLERGTMTKLPKSQTKTVYVEENTWEQAAHDAAIGRGYRSIEDARAFGNHAFKYLFKVAINAEAVELFKGEDKLDPNELF